MRYAYFLLLLLAMADCTPGSQEPSVDPDITIEPDSSVDPEIRQMTPRDSIIDPEMIQPPPDE